MVKENDAILGQDSSLGTNKLLKSVLMLLSHLERDKGACALECRLEDRDQLAAGTALTFGGVSFNTIGATTSKGNFWRSEHQFKLGNLLASELALEICCNLCCCLIDIMERGIYAEKETQLDCVPFGFIPSMIVDLKVVQREKLPNFRVCFDFTYRA